MTVVTKKRGGKRRH